MHVITACISVVHLFTCGIPDAVSFINVRITVILIVIGRNDTVPESTPFLQLIYFHLGVDIIIGITKCRAQIC